MLDRCMVCTERNMGSEIIMDSSMELVGDLSHVESRFSPFGDNISVNARLVHGLC
jgi:hypothetical protein